MISPSLTEADMRQANGSPSEERSKTRQSDEPVEDDFTSSSQVHVTETAPCKNEDDRPERTSGAINVGEELGRITLVGKSSEGTRSTVNTRYTDGNDGDENDNVHERIITLQTGILASNDERRGVGTTSLSSEKALVIRADEQTDEEETEDVEPGYSVSTKRIKTKRHVMYLQGNSPENLTNRTRERLERIRGLSSGQTN